MLADDYVGIIQVLVAGVLAFIALLALRRTTGNRPVMDMSAFDVVVLIVMGLTLTAVLLWESVSLAEGMLAFAIILILLQVSTMRQGETPSAPVEPVLMARKGQTLSGAIKRVGVSQAQLVAAVQECGYSGIEHTDAVVLETNGQLSVIDDAGNITSTSFPNVTPLTSWRRERKDG